MNFWIPPIICCSCILSKRAPTTDLVTSQSLSEVMDCIHCFTDDKSLWWRSACAHAIWIALFRSQFRDTCKGGKELIMLHFTSNDILMLDIENIFLLIKESPFAILISQFQISTKLTRMNIEERTKRSIIFLQDLKIVWKYFRTKICLHIFND